MLNGVHEHRTLLAEQLATVEHDVLRGLSCSSAGAGWRSVCFGHDAMHTVFETMVTQDQSVAFCIS